MSRPNRFFLKIASSFSLIFVGLILLAWILPLPPRVQTEYSKVVLFNDQSLLRSYLTSDSKWRFPLSLDSQNQRLSQALSCIEDKRFYWHIGVDPLAMARAFYQNFRNQKRISGGSTITMQVARLLEPKDRTYFNKFIESFRAFQLEMRLSKKEILELYLSYAPFGRNIEGLETASYLYFNKSARFLSSSELAFLLMLPQAPHRLSALKAEDLQQIRNRNLQKMFDCHLITDSEFQSATKESLPTMKNIFEFHAEHFADFVKETKSSIVKSTLSATYQKAIEKAVTFRRNDFRRSGIHNLGVLVWDIPRQELRSAIGNFDYFDTTEDQSYNSVFLHRSTGSLIKPFFFAHLLQNGEITPESLLLDIPLSIQGYEPKNFSGEFSGLVEAKWALAHSLNLPWVHELRRTGIDSFLHFLFRNQLETPQAKENLGLSLVVGGLQTRLWDLSRMYLALAHDGVWSDGVYVQDQKAETLQWINADAAHLTSQALGLRGRPDFGLDAKYLRFKNTVRWKTGTSQNFHDAWAIGFDKKFLVAVWLGNLDNEASPSLVGPEVAAPLMFDIFDLVREKASYDWLAGADDIAESEQEVCAFSGYLATSSCPHKKKVPAVKGLALRQPCPYHKELLIDKKSGLRVTQECSTEQMQPVLKSFLFLPAEVKFWYEKQMGTIHNAPRFHSHCTQRPLEKALLKIISPEETTYLLHGGLALGQINLPLRIQGAETATQKCFLNGQEIKRKINDINETLNLARGDYNLMCLDAAGGSDRIDFRVE